MILCFAKAMGEFGATITFVSNIPGETQTLPSAIYTFTQVPGGDAGAMRLTLVSVAISMLALLGLRGDGAPSPTAGSTSNDARASTSGIGSATFRLDAPLRDRRRAGRAVRPLGRRQDLARQRHRRADPPRRRVA